VVFVWAQYSDEHYRIAGHLLAGRWRGPAGGADTAVIEGDDRMPRGDAVDDSGITVVKDRGQVGEEDHRHPRARAELTVGELHAARGKSARGGVLPRRHQVVVHVC